MREARGALPRAPYDRVRLAAQPATAFRASPSSPASVADISTTSRPPPSRGTRMTMPRPSFVTSSGPSPVLGFLAALPHPLPRVAPPPHPVGTERIRDHYRAPALQDEMTGGEAHWRA